MSWPFSLPAWRRDVGEWLAVVLVFVAGAALIIGAMFQDFRSVEESTRERLARDVRHVNAYLAQKIRSIDTAIQSLQMQRFWATPAASGGMTVATRLDHIATSMMGIRSILILDERGVTTASNRPDLVGLDFSRGQVHPAVKSRASSGFMKVTSPFLTPLGTFTVGLGKQLVKPSGQFDGSAIFILDPPWFIALLEPFVDSAPGARVSLVHRDGRVFHSEPQTGPDSGGDSPFPESWAQRVLGASEAGTFDTGPDEAAGRRLVAFAPIVSGLEGADHQLFTVASQEWGRMAARIERRAAVRLGWLAAGALAASGFLWAFQRRRHAQDQATQAKEAERQLAERKLRAVERDLRLAVEGAGLGVWRWDPARGELETSPTLRTLLGVPSNEPLTADQLLCLVHPDDSERVSRAFDSCLTEGLPLQVDHRIVRPDGSVHWLRLVASAFAEGVNGHRCLHGIARDITTHKALELLNEENRANLSELVEQQVAVQTVSAFAHDLNQPLLAISAYSEAALALLRRGEGDAAKLERMVDGTFEQAQRAGALIHDMSAQLTHALYQRNDIEPFDLNEVVRQCVEEASEKRMGVAPPVLDLAPGLPKVLGSRVRTGRVLGNLLANAHEANRASGAGVSRPAITVTTRAGGAMAEVSVHDCGPGIPAASAERVFSPFFTTKDSGLGLGLSISRALAESQGGRLDLIDGAGPGAHFRFSIPLAKPHGPDLPG